MSHAQNTDIYIWQFSFPLQFYIIAPLLQCLATLDCLNKLLTIFYAFCCCFHFMKAISHSRMCITVVLPWLGAFHFAFRLKTLLNCGKQMAYCFNKPSHWRTHKHAYDRQKMEQKKQKNQQYYTTAVNDTAGTYVYVCAPCTSRNPVHPVSLDTVRIEVQMGVKHTRRWHRHLQSAQQQPIKRWSHFFPSLRPRRFYSTRNCRFHHFSMINVTSASP